MTLIPLRLHGLNDQDGDVDLGPYVTLDWDMYPVAVIDGLKARIKRDPRVSRAWIRVSSFKGHHAILELETFWTTGRNFVPFDLFVMRDLYDDDRARLAWDRGRDDPVGILFDWKKGRFSGDWERFKG